MNKQREMVYLKSFTINIVFYLNNIVLNFSFFSVDNVNEYLKLASNADKQQLARIKSIFEKKNQKSAVSISQLQKKLEGYNKRLKDLETHGLTTSHHLKQPKEMLRDVGHGLR